MTTTSAIPTEAGPAVPTSSARIRVAAAALGVAAATVAVLLATKPWGDRLDSSADNVLDYDNLLDVRGAAWAATLVDGFAYAVVALTLGLGVLHLVRSRGRVTALVGAVLA